MFLSSWFNTVLVVSVANVVDNVTMLLLVLVLIVVLGILLLVDVDNELVCRVVVHSAVVVRDD